jgi:hypothetical protein
VGVPGPYFPHGPLGAQFHGSAANSEEQSLWAAEVLGPYFLHGLQGVPSVTVEQWVSLAFQGEGSRSCIRGEGSLV